MAKDKPVHEIRLGRIKAAIWRNQNDTGVRFNTTFCRIYKDGEDWKDTDSYGRDDLLVVAKVADMANSWIYEQGQQEEQDEKGGKSSARR